ncbi:MAG: energy transducer TonB [Parafilimonas sp.]
MLPEKIMQSDLLDILFENRNKSYGAYALRRSYNKRLASAISVTFFITILFSVFQFMHHAKNDLYTTQVIIPPDYVFTKIEAVKPPLKIPVHQSPLTHFRQINNSAPVIVNNDVKQQMPTVEETIKSVFGETNISGDDATDMIQPPANTNAGTGTIVTQPAKIKEVNDAPLIWAQVMPEYPGGLDALRKFMLRNLRQPDDFQAGEKIIVTASFVVNKNGQIGQVKIINTGRNDLNKEVQRVINKMPLWKPGIQNGNAVAVYFNLPVTFMSAEE